MKEINFKLDKLSSRLSKVQADNQLRFQELENNSTQNNNDKKICNIIAKKEKQKCKSFARLFSATRFGLDIIQRYDR